MSENIYTIANDFLQMKFTSFASEWTSLIDKSTDLEYAWSGDPQYWSGRNPTLFPFVGKLNGEQYLYDGNVYKIGNHGFARRQEFTLSAKSEDSLSFVLQDNDDTMLQYPFHFRLTNRYQLRGSTLQVSTTVINLADKLMPLTLGAHPAFRCPLREGENLTDYKIVFPRTENLRRRLMNPDSSWQSELIDYATTDTIYLSSDLFASDVLAFEGLTSPWVELQGPQPDERVRLYRGNSDILGIWQKPGSPFVCLEPWRGRGDIAGWQGDIMTRPDTHFLQPGSQLALTYSLRIGA